MFRGMYPSLVTIKPLLAVELQKKGTHVGLIEWDVIRQWFDRLLTTQPLK
jgi:hypothetical protein